MSIAGIVRKIVVSILLVTVILLLCSQTAFCAQGASFHCMYDKSWWDLGIWGWTFIIISAVGIGIITYVTGGVIVPWMASLGGWIGSCVGLHGIVAVNWGLAILGGGAVSAGGLGIAGGVAVLTAAASVLTGAVTDYGINYAMTKWEAHQFLEDSKLMNTLPLPINKYGGTAYEETFQQIMQKVKITEEESIESENNQAALKECIQFLEGKIEVDKEPWKCAKNYSLLALLYFQANDYLKAQEMAKKACEFGEQNGELAALPLFISSVSELYKSNRDTLQSINDFRGSLRREQTNVLIPLMFAIYMDRVMYMYHEKQLTVISLRNVMNSTDVLGAVKYKPELLNIITMRIMIEIKRTQQDIFMIYKNKADSSFSSEEKTSVAKARLKTHEELLDFLDELILKMEPIESKMPKDAPTRPTELKELVKEYREAIPALRLTVENIEAEPTSHYTIKNTVTMPTPNYKVKNDESLSSEDFYFSTGLNYYLGTNNVPQNYMTAAYYFECAAKNNHSEAAWYLGLCYEHGQGVTIDRNEAINWYRKAGLNGNECAQQKLIEMGELPVVNK